MKNRFVGQALPDKIIKGASVKNIRRKYGFTLLELLVVVIIIAVLAALAAIYAFSRGLLKI